MLNNINILGIQKDGIHLNTIAGEIAIHPDYFEMPEHFPGAPVVPAYMQFEFIQAVLKEAGETNPVRRFYDVKFIAQIVPPKTIQYHINQVEKKYFNFSFFIEDINDTSSKSKIVATKGKFELFY